MKLKPEQLARQLAKQLPPLIWLAGDEPLLMQESADLVRRYCRDAQFGEREIFHVERSFNWDLFLQAGGNMSLFGERKLIELRLASAKPDDAAKKALQAYLDDPNPDFLVLVSSPRLEAATLKTKWFQAIETTSALVQIWPINRDNLAQWLQQRLLREKISADSEALQILVDRTEGNLLAAMQEIEKLKLLANTGADAEIHLDAKTVLQTVADNSRYTAFSAVDAALAGDAGRAQKVLNGLRAEGVVSQVILGAVTRELHTLLAMVQKREQGQGVNAILQSARVWYNRKQVVGSALQRLSSDTVWQLLEQARRVDQAGKGMLTANPWDELSMLLLGLAGKPVATMALRGAGPAG
jgi:DNA polymerase-3 subunit delta